MPIPTAPPLPDVRRGTPASPVAVRCARLRASRGFDLIPAALVGVLGGIGVFIAELVLAFTSPGAFTFNMLGAIGTIRPASLAGPLALFALLMWLMPRLSRWSFDQSAKRWTREQLFRRRSRRRYATRLTWALILTTTLAAAVAVTHGGWQVAALAAAKVAAVTGGVILCQSLRGRRGRHLVCVGCEYPMRTWRGAAPCCPECANEWRKPWRARLGSRAVQWPPLLFGAALLIASAAAVGSVRLWGLA